MIDFVCDRCSITMDPTKTSALHDEDGRMIGMVDEYSHVCVDGWMVHPFAMIPFPDERDALRESLIEAFPPIDEEPT
jgi:hypothetical protein